MIEYLILADSETQIVVLEVLVFVDFEVQTSESEVHIAEPEAQIVELVVQIVVEE